MSALLGARGEDAAWYRDERGGMHRSSNAVTSSPRAPTSDDCLHGRTVVHEVDGAGVFEQLRGQLPRFATIVGERQRVIDEIARMAAAQRHLPRPIEAV